MCKFNSPSDWWVHQYTAKRSRSVYSESQMKFKVLYSQKYGIYWQPWVWTLNQKTWIFGNKFQLSCWELWNLKTNLIGWWISRIKTFMKVKIGNRRSIFRWFSWKGCFHADFYRIWQNWRRDWKSVNSNSQQYHQSQGMNGECSSWNNC